MFPSHFLAVNPDKICHICFLAVNHVPDAPPINLLAGISSQQRVLHTSDKQLESEALGSLFKQHLEAECEASAETKMSSTGSKNCKTKMKNKSNKTSPTKLESPKAERSIKKTSNTHEGAHLKCEPTDANLDAPRDARSKNRNHKKRKNTRALSCEEKTSLGWSAISIWNKIPQMKLISLFGRDCRFLIVSLIVAWYCFMENGGFKPGKPCFNFRGLFY